ncbi:hypothetical protein HMPREF9436_02581 [Faecalibacterium cf. prausnitzii KLE1255]|uniref:Uncharacterized protein n=1 Tax=Faecalibacterium cf. prausnitzii KLE1255 TaxID=748224 RepID=E2ZLM2_9FIRM|nr:hypothetical protein HMPREF9436_02581 [Faecalibacterium cf. prausnitzii KLE1255]
MKYSRCATSCQEPFGDFSRKSAKNSLFLLKGILTRAVLLR